MNEAEQRFAAYLDAHGYAWEFEPPWAEELGTPVATQPDFLVRAEGLRLACEVRQFTTTRITDELRARGGSGTLDSKLVFGPLRSALVEKALQLRPLANLGMPLVIVVGNPLGADVMLDEMHVRGAMFGNPMWSIPIDRATGGPAGPAHFGNRDYGAFCSLVDGEFVNLHPHVSAVAVAHERLNSRDWRDEILAKHRAPDRSLDAAYDAAFQAIDEINLRIAAGEEPVGAYQWLEVFELDGEEAVPVPRSVFAGERDVRYGFLDAETYSRLDL